MQPSFSFFSHDFGDFVLAKKILEKYPQNILQFTIIALPKSLLELPSSKFTKTIETSFNRQHYPVIWELALQNILQNKTKFGRIGLFYDQHNHEFENFSKILQQQTQLKNNQYSYEPLSPKRAEKTPKINLFPTPFVTSMANNMIADSVEFRRLIRKYIRKAKNANCDTIMFGESIMEESKISKIIQHIAGSQMKVSYFSDFFLKGLPVNLWKSDSIIKPKKQIEIWTDLELEFTKNHAEKLLGRKLAKDCVYSL